MSADQQASTLAQFVMISRIQTMTPNDSKNLDMFLKEYEAYGCYYLAPAIMPEGTSQPQLLEKVLIHKNDLVVRAAWEVEEHDDDIAALQIDDKPIIPDDVSDPPVLRALARKMAMHSQ